MWGSACGFNIFSSRQIYTNRYEQYEKNHHSSCLVMGIKVIAVKVI